MSERLQSRAEVIKLARLLSVEEAELSFLEMLPSSELRQFRESATHRLFDAGAQMLGRVASAAKLLPSQLVATIAQRAFGPLLCARAAGSVDTAKALDVAKRLSPRFLADVTVELDPRSVAAIIADVPPELVVPVAHELGQRAEYVTMGRFLAYVPDHAIAAAMDVLSDEAMLYTAFVLEHKDRLDHALGLLPPYRLRGILRCAAENDHWPEALDLIDNLSDEHRGPIADLVAEQDESLIAALVAAVSEAGIWDGLLPVVRDMSQQSLARLVRVPAFHDPEILARIIDAAARQGLWRDLAVLIDALPPQVHAVVTAIASELDADLLANVVRSAVAAPEALPPLMSIVGEMDATATARVSNVINAVAAEDPSVISEVLNAAADRGIWRELAPLLELLSGDGRAMVAVLAAELPRERLNTVVRDAIAAPETLPVLTTIVDAMDEAGQQLVAEVIDAVPESLALELLSRLDSAEQDELARQLPPIVQGAVSRVRGRHGNPGGRAAGR